MNNKKSCSLLEKIVNVNYSKNAKFLILIPVIIIALAMMFTCIFGINYSRELQKRYEFVVDFGVEIEDSNISEYMEKINAELEKNDLSTAEYKKHGQYIYTGLMITLNPTATEFTEEEITSIQESIEKELRTSLIGTVEVSEMQLIKPDIMGFVWKMVLACAIIAIAIFVYLWIRFSLLISTSITMVSVMAPALTFAIYGLFRLPFGYASLAIIMASMLVTLVLSIIFFDRIRNKIMETQNITNNEYIVEAQKIMYNTINIVLLVMVCFSLVTSLIMLVFSAYLFTIFVGLSIALLIALYLSMYASPSLWSCIYNKEKDQRLKNRLEREAKRVEKKAKKDSEKKEDEKLLV